MSPLSFPTPIRRASEESMASRPVGGSGGVVAGVGGGAASDSVGIAPRVEISVAPKLLFL